MSEPAGNLEEAPVEVVSDIMSDILFNCSTGFNFTTDAPPIDIDDKCDPASNSASLATNICEGEVWQEDFWHKELVSFAYAHYNYSTCVTSAPRGTPIETCEIAEVFIDIADL